MTQFNLVEPLITHGLSLVKTDWHTARSYLPYVALYQPTEAGNLILLNRSYKPLGLKQSTHVDYKDPRFDYCRFVAPEDQSLDVKQLDGLGWAFWFYNDSTAPRASDQAMATYLQKLYQQFATYSQKSDDISRGFAPWGDDE